VVDGGYAAVYHTLSPIPHERRAPQVGMHPAYPTWLTGVETSAIMDVSGIDTVIDNRNASPR
jgi:hypothetical protein